VLTCYIPSDWLCADFWYKLVWSWTQLRVYVRVALPLIFFQFLLHTFCHSWHKEPSTLYTHSVMSSLSCLSFGCNQMLGINSPIRLFSSSLSHSLHCYEPFHFINRTVHNSFAFYPALKIFVP